MKRYFAIAVVALVASSPALADGDAPTRKMNAAEAGAFKELQGSIRAALPKTPPNYAVKYGGFDRNEVPEAIGADRMLGMSFTAVYSLNQGFREARQQSAMMDMTKGTQDQQAKRSALGAREAELTRVRDDRTRSRAERDRARAELKTVRAELSALDDQAGAQYLASLQGGGAESTLRKVDSDLPAGELSVRVRVNQDANIDDRAGPYKAPGGHAAFEQGENCDGYPDKCCITVLLGAFDKEKRNSGYTRYNLRKADLRVPTKARGMEITVFGPKDKPESVRELLRKTDLAKLKAMLP